MFLSKHDINHNRRSQRIKQRLKSFLQISLFPSLLLDFQGRQGPKGDPGDPGLPGRQVSTPPTPPILWFMNRKQETIHGERRCYWSLDSVGAARLKPHSGWEVYHAILWETHTLNSARWLTNGGRPARQWNYYGAQTWVTDSGNREWNMFLPSLVIENDWDLVKAMSIWLTVEDILRTS